MRTRFAIAALNVALVVTGAYAQVAEKEVLTVEGAKRILAVASIESG